MPEDNGEQKPAPQRLQGLASRGRGGMLSGRGGRFMPNAVNRRSKEERESSAPAIKPQDPPPGADKPPRKFERRKPRQLGTRAEAAGPLAAPTIAAAARGPTISGTVSDGSRPRTSVRIKQDPDAASGISTLNPDHRIDMAAATGDSFFPLRMDRQPPADSGPAAAKPGPAVSALPGQIVDSAPGQVALAPGPLYLLQLPALGLAPGKAPEDSALARLARRPEPGVETRPRHPDPAPGPKIKAEDPDEPAGDVTMPDATGDDAANGRAGGANHAEEAAKNADANDAESPLSQVGPAGRLGTLRTHASGKVTMVIGETVYEVLAGTEGRSLEELLLVDEESRQAYELGPISQRLLMVPDLASLHI